MEERRCPKKAWKTLGMARIKARHTQETSFTVDGISLASGILTTFVTKPERSNIQV
jgi:hypothetical protein